MRKKYKIVRNWMVKHMAAYPETAKGFYVRFIDYPEDNGFIVKQCNKDVKDKITIDGLNYRIYSYDASDLSGFIKIFTDEIGKILESKMSFSEIKDSLKSEIFDVLLLSPSNKFVFDEIKEKIMEALMNDPKFMESNGNEKDKIIKYINKSFDNINKK